MHANFRLAFVMVAAFALLAGSAPATAAAADEVTFTKDVAPILQRSCQGCHRPGALAPISFLTYEDARPWARAMKQKTALREMPPWFIEKNIGVQHFKDDLSLSDEEIATIGAWADAGRAARQSGRHAARGRMGGRERVDHRRTRSDRGVAQDGRAGGIGRLPRRARPGADRPDRGPLRQGGRGQGSAPLG